MISWVNTSHQRHLKSRDFNYLITRNEKVFLQQKGHGPGRGLLYREYFFDKQNLLSEKESLYRLSRLEAWPLDTNNMSIIASLTHCNHATHSSNVGSIWSFFKNFSIRFLWRKLFLVCFYFGNNVMVFVVQNRGKQQVLLLLFLVYIF